MSQVKFVIDGDIKGALTALKDFNAALDKAAKNPAIRGLQTTFDNVARQIGRVNSGLRHMSSFLAQMRSGGNSMANSLNGAVRNYIKINASTNNYTRNLTQAQRQTQQLTQQTSGLNKALQGTATLAAKIGLSLSKGFGKAAVGFRGSVGSGLGGIQSLGIGVRMSGIAMGNQLSQIMGGALSGNFLSPVLNTLKGIINTSVGLVNIGSQMATRIVTGLAGTVVKMIGPVVGGAINAFVGSLGAGIAMSTQGVTRLLGATLAGMGDVVQNVASGITQFAGEIVIQMGNVFTGLTEVFRGAFQAAVNVAAGVLNGLVGIAGAIAEKVAGVLGKTLTGVIGGGVALGGLALKDRLEAESAVTGATVLFSGKVSSAEKQAFKKRIMALRNEFPTLEGEGIGKAAEMLVSTGFQDSPQMAGDFLRGLLPVAEVSNLQNLPELARTAAKVYNLFRDEIDKAAKADGVGAGEFLAGRLFQVRNVGDLEISDLATHLGEAAGVGKAFNLTLDETLEQLAQLSLGLAPDETFTAFRSIITRLQDPAKETRELFADLGVKLKVMTPEVQAQVKGFDSQRKSIEGQIAALEKVKGKHKKIADLKKQLKMIDEQESKVLRHAPSRNALDIVRELLDKGLSEEELAVAFPNVRGLKGIAIQKALTPETKASVAAAFQESPGAAVRNVRGQRQEDGAFKFAKIFRAMKAPFDTFFDAAEPTFKKFLDDTASTFGRLGDFVKEAFADEGAAKFAENLGGKLLPLVQPLIDGFEALVNLHPAAFWGALNDGLNATAKAIQGVIGFGGTVLSILGDIVDATPGIQSAWEAVSGFFGAVGDGIERTAAGDKTPITSIFDNIFGALESLIVKAKTLLASFLADLAGMVSSLSATLAGIWDDVAGGASNVLVGLGSFFGASALLGAGGGAAGAAGAAGGATGAGAAGLLGKTGGLMKGLGRMVAPFVAFDLGSQIASGEAPGSFGGSAMNVLGGAGAGAAIGSAVPVIGTLIGAIVGGLAGLLPDILGSGPAQASPVSKEFDERIQALTLALSTGHVYDISQRTMTKAIGSGSEIDLAMLKQKQQLMAINGSGDTFIGGLANKMIEDQIAALEELIQAERELAAKMDWEGTDKVAPKAKYDPALGAEMMKAANILSALGSASSQSNAAAILKSQGLPGVESLRGEAAAKFSALPKGQAGKVADAQARWDSVTADDPEGIRAKRLMQDLGAQGFMVKGGKVSEKSTKGSLDRVRGLTSDWNLAYDQNIGYYKNAAASEAADMAGQPKNVLGGEAKKGKSPRTGSLIKRDEQGRQYVLGANGKREYLATTNADAFSQFGGKALTGSPSLGSFGFTSGRELAKEGRTGFMGFGAKMQPGSLENRMQANAKKLMGAGIEEAKGGNVQASGEAAKMGTELLDAANKDSQNYKTLIDWLKKFVDAVTENVTEKDEAVVEHAEGTTQAVEIVSGSVKELRARLDALADREAAAAEGTR